VDYLKGDSKKAFKKLKFKPKFNINSLIKDMVTSDLILAEKDSRLK
jgi:GDPmannose 4,6-dehydratase